MAGKKALAYFALFLGILLLATPLVKCEEEAEEKKESPGMKFEACCGVILSQNLRPNSRFCHTHTLSVCFLFVGVFLVLSEFIEETAQDAHLLLCVPSGETTLRVKMELICRLNWVGSLGGGKEGPRG